MLKPVSRGVFMSIYQYFPVNLQRINCAKKNLSYHAIKAQSMSMYTKLLEVFCHQPNRCGLFKIVYVQYR